VTDVLWPPDLAPSSQTWNILGNAAAFVSPLNGTTRTYGRPGVRMGCAITLPPINGQNRARMLSLLAALKDRSNRIWVPDFTTSPRGSFPATEILTNNDFSNGTAGWSGSNATLSESDRVLRATFNGVGTECDAYNGAGLSVTQYAPYALRSFIKGGSWNSLNTIGPVISDTVTSVTGYSTDRGLRTASKVMLSATTGNIFAAVGLFAGAGQLAGTYYETQWTSLSRCILVDGGQNALLRSDEMDHAAWTKTRTTASANADTAPDGTTTADRLIEDSSASTTHLALQAATVSSAAADYCFTVAVKAGTRTFAVVQMVEATGGTGAEVYINLSTGATSNVGTGANWSGTRAFAVDLGNGWYQVAVVSRKTNAATSIEGRVYLATAAGTASYSGDGASYIRVWRATLAQSAVPVRLTQTTSASTTGTTQTGNAIHVKGLPVSTDGLLKAGDMVGSGGQVAYLTAPLNSDSAGSGTLSVGAPFRVTTNDTPIHVNTPMCKMLLSPDQLDIDTMPGRFSPFTLELIEAID
jgi:hypothetical protein